MLGLDHFVFLASIPKEIEAWSGRPEIPGVGSVRCLNIRHNLVRPMHGRVSSANPIQLFRFYLLVWMRDLRRKNSEEMTTRWAPL
jgi:hypothetical protein